MALGALYDEAESRTWNDEVECLVSPRHSKDKTILGEASLRLRSGRTTHGILLSITIVLAILCLILSVTCITALQKVDQWRRESRGLAEEINGLVPKFSLGPKRFLDDLDFEWDANSTAEERARIDSNWKTRMMPTGGGSLLVNNPEKHQLPSGVFLHQDPETQYNRTGQDVWILAVFHQLHCLWALADALKALYFNDTSPLVHRPQHSFHCIEYLRVSLMCFGDTTFEGTGTSATGLTASQGWGSTHTCKNWDELFRFAEETTTV